MCVILVNTLARLWMEDPKAPDTVPFTLDPLVRGDDNPNKKYCFAGFRIVVQSSQRILGSI